VGRDVERALLVATIANQTASGFVVAGNSGVGKTRLALEGLKDAEKRGYAPRWVVATGASKSIPFGPFAQFLRQTPTESRIRVETLCHITDALIAGADGRRLVIGIDDAHLLDEASAVLVHQLAMTGDAFVLITVRSGTWAPEPIIALWKDGLVERLELQALSQAQVAEFVPAVLQGDVDGPTIAKLWETTRGNLLFLREIVLAGLECGSLTRSMGLWSWQGTIVMSPMLCEVVAGQLRNLEPDEKALAELLAYGEPVSAALLETLFSPTTLEAAEHKGVVLAEQSGRRTLVRLAHPVYAEAMRALCPPLRARAVHQQLARALSSAGTRRRGDRLRLATTGLEAGQHAPAHLLVAAARQAIANHDPVLGERLARAGIGAGGVGSQLVLAQSLIAQGRYEEAEILLGASMRKAASAADRVAIVKHIAIVLWLNSGRTAEAEAALLLMAQQVRNTNLRAELEAVRGTLLLFEGNPQASLSVVSPIMEADHVGQRAGLLAALAAVPALAVSGCPERAIIVADRWMPAADRSGRSLPFAIGQLNAGKIYSLCQAGHFTRAESLAAREYADALNDHDQGGTALSAMLLGKVALGRGRVQTARHWLREAACLFRVPGSLNLLPGCLAYLAQAAALAGDNDEGQAALSEAEAKMTSGMLLFQPELALARAWVAQGRGEKSAARAAALDAANRAEGTGQRMLTVMALHDLLRLGGDLKVATWLDDIASHIEGPLARHVAAHARARAARDANGLDAVAQAFASLGASLLAAEAATEASFVHESMGQMARSHASAARARQCLEECEGALTPVSTSLPKEKLTLREIEVANLANTGLSNNEIALRLVVSTRTVESHLQRAYAKLGVASRQELRSAFHPKDAPRGSG
jgi:DNA-binding CsgD family transcriptional regulator